MEFRVKSDLTLFQICSVLYHSRVGRRNIVFKMANRKVVALPNNQKVVFTTGGELQFRERCDVIPNGEKENNENEPAGSHDSQQKEVVSCRFITSIQNTIKICFSWCSRRHKILVSDV